MMLQVASKSPEYGELLDMSTIESISSAYKLGTLLGSKADLCDALFVCNDEQLQDGKQVKHLEENS